MNCPSLAYQQVNAKHTYQYSNDDTTPCQARYNPRLDVFRDVERVIVKRLAVLVIAQQRRSVCDDERFRDVAVEELCPIFSGVAK